MVVVTQGKLTYGDGATALSEVEEAQEGVDTLARRLKTSLAELHGLQDEFEQAVKRQEKALTGLEKSLAELDGPSGATAAASSSNASNANANARTVLRSLRARLSARDLQSMLPRSGGFFVELFLGGLNVRFMRQSERLSFKTEYEKLKLKLAPGLVFLCVVCLIFEKNRWLHMLLQFCLSGYYVTLAVRENILRVNGSNIRAWWIIHHYFTMMQCVLLTTWPDNASYAACRKGLHLFGLYNSVLQVLQTRYQMARLYALRSLGMIGEMDVVSTDSSQIHWSERMAVILPLILLGQAMQAGQAWSLLRVYQAHRRELQILSLAALFFANFVGNLYTTLLVLHDKRKQHRA